MTRRTAITDEGLKELTAFKQLRSLRLEGDTRVTDAWGDRGSVKAGAADPGGSGESRSSTAPR